MLALGPSVNGTLQSVFSVLCLALDVFLFVAMGYPLLGIHSKLLPPATTGLPLPVDGSHLGRLGPCFSVFDSVSPPDRD